MPATVLIVLLISSLSVNLFICRLLSNDTALRQATIDSAFSINNISARKPRQLGCSNLQPTIQVFADMQASGPALYVQLLSDACIIQLPLKKTSKKTVFSRKQANPLAFFAGKSQAIVTRCHYHLHFHLLPDFAIPSLCKLPYIAILFLRIKNSRVSELA